jgi:hypothetical protein
VSQYATGSINSKEPNMWYLAERVTAGQAAQAAVALVIMPWEQLP